MSLLCDWLSSGLVCEIDLDLNEATESNGGYVHEDLWSPNPIKRANGAEMINTLAAESFIRKFAVNYFC